MERGKGNKLFNIPSAKAASREEVLVGAVVVEPDAALAVFAGDRRMTIDWAGLKAYRGERAQRGAVLPRGWRGVTRLEPG
jgi:topoisomerase-4 subunit A